MFQLLVLLISLLASNDYGVVGITLDASLLTQLGYDNQSTSIILQRHDITDIDPNAFQGYTKVTTLGLPLNQVSKIDLGWFKDMVNLKSLDLLGSQIAELTNKQKITFPFLESLNLAACAYLTSLNSNVTNALPNLTFLDVQYSFQLSPLKPNQLSALKKLQFLYITTKNQTSLTKEHFNGLNSLYTLAFRESKIKTIEVHSLLALPNVAVVDFQNNDITAFEYLQIPERLFSLSLQGNKMNYFMLSRTMGYLKCLYIGRNKFRSFKSMDFTFLANLTALDLSNNPHAYPYEISGHLKPLVKLDHIYLSNLSISSIDSNYFSQNLMLYEIDLSRNKISVLPYDTFSHLKGLGFLDLSYNQISVLDNRTLVDIKTFIYINFGYNSLTKIAPRTFYNLTNLIYLHLPYNLISEIDSSAFVGLQKLRILNLDGNRLTKLSINTFENRELDQLFLSNNLINELDNTTFMGILSIGVLKLGFNNISSIGPGTFDNVNLTQTLDLSNNRLTEISNSTFAGQNQLISIYLNNNEITNIEPGAFNNLTNLQTIYLYYNNLTQLDVSTFAGCNNLQAIYLNNNPSLSQSNSQSLCPTTAANCNVYFN